MNELQNTSTRLFIRADMNEIVATGHIMRCLSVADFAKEIGVETTFILADEKAQGMVKNRGYDTIILNSRWDDLNSEIAILDRLIEEKQIENLLVDSYFATDVYLEKLSKLCKVSYFDDLNDKQYPADILIAYDACWDENEYCKKHKASTVLWGYDYIPLRKEFLDKGKRKVSEEAKNLLILSGGADSKHSVKRFLEQKWVDHFENVTAICGRLNADYDELSEKYKNSGNVIIKSSVDNISEYMEQADICISAAGNALYECCACGTPTISFAMNETQIPAAKKLASEGVAVYAGCIDLPAFFEKFSGELETVRNDFLKRKEMTEKARLLIDGKGSLRIAETITGKKGNSNGEAF